MLVSLSDVLRTKHESMETTYKIMESLKEIFGRKSDQSCHETTSFNMTSLLNELPIFKSLNKTISGNVEVIVAEAKSSKGKIQKKKCNLKHKKAIKKEKAKKTSQA